MAETTLRDIPVGSMARIVEIRPTHRSYRSKLLSMGLTKGTVLLVVRVAPLGDPVVVSVRGFDLSLRKEEATALVLTPVDGDPEAFGFPGMRFRHGGHRHGHGAGRRGRGLFGARARRGGAGHGRGGRNG